MTGLLPHYNDATIPITPTKVQQAATLCASAQQQGHVVHFADSLIAGTAKAHQLILATRNVGDFVEMEIEVTNPWDAK